MTEPKVDESRGSQALEVLLESMTQKELEGKTGVLQSTVSDLLNLKRLPNRRDSLQLRKVGIDPTWWDVPPLAEAPTAEALKSKAIDGEDDAA